ncbi:23S rRNA (guanosine2251-2'-O)-methyltransferase [Mesorhizobium sp. J18]|uniref:23S rRNA (guanosine(2251)-2'-O)-methyltransferase RlmB n=1 Tax=Mesorhizobium sp. J18 TaxID=935263 RepID=UPI001198E261|nr:23S rRNA (guanosine(2251)-2'-O)-methyltransferase RlmB [Mesorhizobium sp. J18]TWG93885.1 23S rRNA (guanosine2251-2'-O)-methyltransferase [Mesorhizobium sp. J18]
MSDHKKTGTARDSHYARLRRAHRDIKGAVPRKRAPLEGKPPPEGLVRLYGLHTVRAALDNPKRVIHDMLVTRNAAQRLGIEDVTALPFPAKLVEPKEIETLTGSEAVHQGVVIEAKPLKANPLDKLQHASLVLVLDQVTDPHNVGAIMRSAVAFGADALMTTARHSPAETGVLAKSASGALEHVNHIEVRNLAAAIEDLHKAGFHTVGLDSEGPQELEESLVGSRIALVLGAEGKGLRQKTRETVNALARLDLPGEIRSLNVSNATAVALYIARRYLSAR